MSWFGETLGDSFTSLKGQIERITKEVLADDKDSVLKERETSESTTKNLEALCESKDLEILSLKDELSKLQVELELLKCQKEINGNNVSNNELSNDQVVQLQNEIIKLTEEKNHLNFCIDELQLEHQKNLSEVFSVRDRYKKEVEELKKENNDAIKKFQELSQIHNSLSNKLEKQCQDIDEKELLTSQIKNLEVQLNKSHEELTECKKALSNVTANCELLHKQVESLTNEIETLKEEKKKIEGENQNIRQEIENVFKDFETVKKDNSNLNEQLNKLSEEKEAVRKQLMESNKSDLNLVNSEEIKKKLQKILGSIEFSEVEKKYQGLDDIFRLIENNLDISKRNSEEKVEKLQKVVDSCRTEIENLNEQNYCLQNELKEQKTKWMEYEKSYQNDLLSAQQKLEETTDLKLKFLELERQSQIHSQSQTDDVKRLEQEVNKLLYLCEMKTDEIGELNKIKTELEQELCSLKNIIDNVNVTSKNDELKKLQSEIEEMKNWQAHLNAEKLKAEEELTRLLSENLNIKNVNAELKINLDEIQKKLDNESRNKKILQDDYDKTQLTLTELQNSYSQLQIVNTTLNGNFENLKAQVSARESSMIELTKSNVAFQNEIGQLQARISELDKSEELQKWKNVALDMELQIQDLNSKIEILESESSKQKVNVELITMKDDEMNQLKQINISLTEKCKNLEKELENKIQDAQLITDLQEENAELKTRIQKFQDQMKIQVVENNNLSKICIQQHKRSKSATNYDSNSTGIQVSEDRNESLEKEIVMLKQMVQNEKRKYEELSRQSQELSVKEMNARKEFERLKQHLIEVEDHYTEQTVENEKIINELKGKLMMTEEQLSNSSTLYTSAKIRDNQHVESLQNQLRLVGAQRDEFQAKLSETEDEIQKHKASLTNLQIVLEQFQQDKKREVEGVTTKYEKQMEATRLHFKELEMEIEGLQQQLSEAKNGLQAASRLGEQLERKSQQIAELERRLTESQEKIVELEQQLKVSNQSVCGKVDKSLIKNLVAGYILSPTADRKSQVLRILASVLDFDQEERNKMGVDASSSGWLAGILHPKSGGPPVNESFSEAFIKFLENESRPKPQVNLLTDQFKAVKSSSISSGEKPQAKALPELILPTFSSSQENESSVILKSVLKDS